MLASGRARVLGGFGLGVFAPSEPIKPPILGVDWDGGDPLDCHVDSVMMGIDRPVTAIPRYSTDSQDAFKLITLLQERQWKFEIQLPSLAEQKNGVNYKVFASKASDSLSMDLTSHIGQEMFAGAGPTLALAICRVVLCVREHEKE